MFTEVGLLKYIGLASVSQPRKRKKKEERRSNNKKAKKEKRKKESRKSHWPSVLFKYYLIHQSNLILSRSTINSPLLVPANSVRATREIQIPAFLRLHMKKLRHFGLGLHALSENESSCIMHQLFSCALLHQLLGIISQSTAVCMFVCHVVYVGLPVTVSCSPPLQPPKKTFKTNFVFIIVLLSTFSCYQNYSQQLHSLLNSLNHGSQRKCLQRIL